MVCAKTKDAMYHHLSTNVDKYTLFIDNTLTEEEQLDKSISSASSFSVLLNPTLDLSALLYLRAIEGKISVRSFFLENLPLAFTKSEYIDVQVSIPPSSVEVNMTLNRSAIAYSNAKVLQLSLDDVCCSEPQSALDYVNEILKYSVNHEIMRRSVVATLDCNIFEDDYLHKLSKEETQLMKHYLCLAVYCRHKIHETLCRHANNCASVDISELVLPVDKRFKFTEENEEKTLRESACLRAKADRARHETQHNIDISLFYDIDITVDSDERKAQIKTIQDATEAWVVDMGFVDDPDPDEVMRYVRSNKCLIEHAIMAHNILSIQKQQLDGRSNPTSSVFQYNFLSLSLDKSGLKCQFHFSPDLYLAEDGTTVQVTFPPQMSYVLGARSSSQTSPPHASQIVVGPLARNQAQRNGLKITDTITDEEQRLPASITTMPKLIYVAVSDIVASLSRDMWLQSTPYANYNIIFCVNVDDQMISSKAIMKEGDESICHKIQRMNNVLERFTIKLLDHNLRQIFLPVATICRICIDIKPVLLDGS